MHYSTVKFLFHECRVSHDMAPLGQRGCSGHAQGPNSDSSTVLESEASPFISQSVSRTWNLLQWASCVLIYTPVLHVSKLSGRTPSLGVLTHHWQAGAHEAHFSSSLRSTALTSSRGSGYAGPRQLSRFIWMPTISGEPPKVRERFSSLSTH